MYSLLGFVGFVLFVVFIGCFVVFTGLDVVLCGGNVTGGLVGTVGPFPPMIDAMCSL